MENHTGKGHVEFSQSGAKLTAEMPGDEEMREHLKEWKENDGFKGSCVIVNDTVNEAGEEKA